MSYTYATLTVSKPVYDEVRKLLEAAGYQHAFDGDAIDMHGIALVPGATTDTAQLSLTLRTGRWQKLQLIVGALFTLAGNKLTQRVLDRALHVEDT